MEVATTATANTHNHSHNRSTHFHQPEEKQMPSHQPHNGINVGLISNGTGSGGARSPFQREVREWQRIDPDTGALLTGRLEADRWINGPMNSYGKISDSQNISQPNGTQHTQRKQLEVLQARTASGAMQVIRAQTVQTTSSRWSSSASTSASTSASSSAIASPIITGSSVINGNNGYNHLKNNTSSESNLLMPSLLSQVSTLNRIHSNDSISSNDTEIEANSLINHFSLNNGHNDIGNKNLSVRVTNTPSQKLSNLMKSNSSLSTNNCSSSSNNSKITTKLNNTHNKKSATGKISLHSIVGGVENMRRITSSPSPTPSPSLSSLTIMKSTSSWQQRQQQQRQRSSQVSEQPTLFGNGNQCQSLTKSRVGVNVAKSSSGCTVGDGVTAIAAVVINEGGDGDSTTPTQLKSRQQKQDLESFRHHNEHQSSSTLTSTSNANVGSDVDNDDNIDDLLRLNKRHQRRQQIPQSDITTPLQRSRSISTDDLTNELDKYNESDDEDAGEWRRVSKLRRSFQSSSNSKRVSSTQPRRPIDLPTNSVSVAKIRAELENGRRLNTAMRNNCVDLAALDTILNGNGETTKPGTSKRSSFLTAESLKEIRAGLKKLSDESLYRDDYVPAEQNNTPDEHIEIQDIKKPPERIRTRQFLAEKLTEITPPSSAFQVFTRPLASVDSSTNGYLTQRSLPNGSPQKHTTHSLESRQKSRESAASIDWHLRRKSYGFEKMSPPDNKTISKKDTSIDSGLGRSGEQLGNWSPIESGTPSTRTTVIHFGENPKVVANTPNSTVVKRIRHLKSPESVDADSDLKRHSIAVDDSQYVRENARKTSQVHLNGYYDGTVESELSTALQPTRLLGNSEAPAPSNVAFRNTNQQKRVEFCKTEVHFAAESGRVNIVETDGKPPPTNNFRRRRRTTSGPLQTIVKSAGTINDPIQSNTLSSNRPVTHFGDIHQNSLVSTSTIAYRSSSQEPLPAIDLEMSNVTITTPKASENSLALLPGSRTCHTSTSGVETTDGGETDEMSAIRGILKNKPAKPIPYHLGENVESADALWGVHLRPVGETAKHEGPKNASPPLMSSASVAERVRIVEQRQDNSSVTQSNGFSTKINLSLVDDPKVWSDTGTTFVTDIALNNGNKNSNQKRSSLQEIMLEDLRKHQRILDQGLKSTSLIIKTMRSANEFDEAMRRLSIASAESTIIPPIIIPTPMLRSHSYQQGTLRHSLTTSYSDIKTGKIKASPFATPRLKSSDETELSVNQQMTQLRCMLDFEISNTMSQEEDSADEEVKRYFNAHQEDESSDSEGIIEENSSLEGENCMEYSSSWSDLKANRTVWHIGSFEGNKETRALERTELPKSNVMSIELHSPHTSLESSESKLVPTGPPVAKPRTFISTKNTDVRPAKMISREVRETQVNKESNNDFLKIVKETRGARKLREHELSYFGIEASRDAENEIKPTYSSAQVKHLKRNLPQRKTNEEHYESTPQIESTSDTTKQQVITKWQLLNDKPDLLRHSPIAVKPQPIKTTATIRPVERKSLRKLSDSDNENDEHIYENIAIDIRPAFRVKSPSKSDEKHHEEQPHYNRKKDLKRDAIILNEMTENADQSMKALSDEAAIKDQRRRSLHRRNSRPLETINEKTIAEKINDKCIAVKITRSTLASEAKRISRHLSPSPTKQTGCTRSSSQSSIEYDNIKIRQKRAPTSLTRTKNPKSESRSTSHESKNAVIHKQCSSSGDEEPIKRAELLRVKKSKGISTGDTRKQSNKDPLHQRDKVQTSSGPLERLLRRSDEHKKRPSSSTAHSSRRERVECSDEVKTHHSRHHLDNKQRDRSHHPSTESNGIRRHRDHKHTGSSSKNHEVRSSTKGSEHPRHTSPTHHDAEREKTSRSKSHSSRSREQKNDRIDGVSHQKDMDSPTKLREHKKSTKQRDPAVPTTHSKTAPIISEQNQLRHVHQQNGNHENHNLHSMTTATIAAKHRESRSGKDRK